jgi:hypothetical protein
MICLQYIGYKHGEDFIDGYEIEIWQQEWWSALPGSMGEILVAAACQ